MQTSDFNPGNSDTGVFWTTPVPPGAVHASPEEAVFARHRLQMDDYINGPNALACYSGPDGTWNPTYPCQKVTDRKVTFETSWRATGGPLTVDGALHRYRCEYRAATASLSWSVHDLHGRLIFESTRVTSSRAFLGHEWSGAEYAG